MPVPKPRVRVRSRIARAARWLLRLLIGSSWKPSSHVGIAGERAAARYMRAKGYRILAQNARTHAAEVDLVCITRDQTTISLVEVKARVIVPGRDDPKAESAVNRSKTARLIRAAKLLRNANGWQHMRVRIDIIAVEWDQPRSTRKSPSRIRHHEGVANLP